MKYNKKTIISIIIILSIVCFIYFKSLNFDSPEKYKNKLPDITKGLQFNEKINDISAIDNNGNIFDMNKYKNSHMILFIGNLETKDINGIESYLSLFLDKSLNQKLVKIYINRYNNETYKPELKQSISYFHDNKDKSIHKIFKICDYCNSIIILNKEHKVLFNSYSFLSGRMLVNIINENKNEIF